MKTSRRAAPPPTPPRRTDAPATNSCPSLRRLCRPQPPFRLLDPPNHDLAAGTKHSTACWQIYFIPQMTGTAATSVIPAAAEDPDRISPLPDCLLTSILSLLPIDAAARTAALSSRWRRLWPSTPLHLIDSRLRPPSADSISRILASHRCNAVRFHLLLIRPSTTDLDSWLRTLALKRLQELVLAPPSEPLRLPPSFHACQSLTAADLTNCRPPEDATASAVSDRKRVV